MNSQNFKQQILLKRRKYRLREVRWLAVVVRPLLLASLLGGHPESVPLPPGAN